MKNIIKICLAVLLTATLFAGCTGEIADSVGSSSPDEATPNEATADAATPDEAIPDEATDADDVEETADVHPVDASWFDDAVFVGDSVTLKLSYYCDAHPEALGNVQFFCAGSLGYNSSLWDIDRQGAVHPSYRGETVLSEYCAEKTGAEKVFIMLGMNDLGYYGIDSAKECCLKLTDNILSHSPGVEIYLESTTPILYGHEIGTLNNSEIRTFNAWLKQTAEEKGYHFINVYDSLCDDAGYLQPQYCSDPDSMGIHFTDAACELWIDILKNSV